MTKKIKISYHSLILFCAVFFVLFYHYTFWNMLLLQNLEDKILVCVSLAVFLIFLLALCLELLCGFYTYKFVLFVIIILGALSAYYMDSFTISINPMIIESLLKTTAREASDFISFTTIIHILALAFVPLCVVLFVKTLKKPSFKAKFFILLSYLLILVLIWVANGKNITFAFKSYKPLIDMLNPIAPIRSSIRYFSNVWHTPKSYTSVGDDAKLYAGDRAKILVLVIGESARAKNLEFNGYTKPTNPYTKDLQTLVNFSNFYSCGVITAISIPCMLTNLTQKTYTSRNLSLYRDNILDIANNVHYDVWWISNNGGSCMGEVCKRIKNISYYDEQFDEAMLQEIDLLIQKAKTNTFLVVNLRGSHGAKYFERYPKAFEYFTPVCKKEELQKCSKEEVINAYDNSLRYSDFVIRQIISSLQHSKLSSALWYVSDHGESLGEFGRYMHGGLSYAFAPKEEKHIASFIWLGKDFDRDFFDVLDKQKDKSFNQDFVFHTLLHLLHIQTKDYNAKLDMLNP